MLLLSSSFFSVSLQFYVQEIDSMTEVYIHIKIDENNETMFHV